MIKEDKKTSFAIHSQVKIYQNQLLSNYTYTLTGGNAEFLSIPKNSSELVYLIQRSIAYNIPYTLLGNASNVIVSDYGLKGLVIITTHFSQIKVIGHDLIVDAGASLKDIANAAAQASLTGFEFACGIPGTLGGAIFMNAGAYDGEIGNIISEVTVIDEKGKIKTFGHEEFKFSYRHSLAQDLHLVILQAKVTLKLGNQKKIVNLMHDLNTRRAAKQPLDLPSCGSVFRRPPGYFVGPMIQKCGLQGKIVGGAQVSLKHAGFIVNINHATANDYITLIKLIQESVFKKFGVHLQTEVRFIGFNDKLSLK